MSVTKKIEKLSKKYSSVLEPGESILAFSSPFILLTNARLIELTVDDDFGNFYPLSEVIEVTRQVESWIKMSVTVGMKDGTRAALLAVMNDQDWSEFQGIFSDAMKRADSRILSNVEPTETQTFGNVAGSGLFGSKYVTIYSKGFVSVSSGMGVFKGQVEELLDISGETDINKKTGLGRAAGAVLTGGFSLIASPNQRGNLYLTITTNLQVHSLFSERPDEATIKVLNQLVGAGKAAISLRSSKGPAAQPQVQQSSSLDAQLQQLADMHSKGILDDAEFKASKAKLLGL